jgi:hypothetical protein
MLQMIKRYVALTSAVSRETLTEGGNRPNFSQAAGKICRLKAMRRKQKPHIFQNEEFLKRQKPGIAAVKA